MTNDLFSWPGPRAKARASNPRTSLEAADSIKPDRIRYSQEIILNILKMYAHLTDEQVFDLLPPNVMSPSGARSRRHELVERGLVVDSGLRSKTKSGRNTIRWKAT